MANVLCLPAKAEMEWCKPSVLLPESQHAYSRVGRKGERMLPEPRRIPLWVRLLPDQRLPRGSLWKEKHTRSSAITDDHRPGETHKARSLPFHGLSEDEEKTHQIRQVTFPAKVCSFQARTQRSRGLRAGLRTYQRSTESLPESCYLSRLPDVSCLNTSGRNATFVLDYRCGAAPDSHRIPFYFISILDVLTRNFYEP